MNPLQKLWWSYTGEVARIVEEEFDDTGDAVGHTVASLLVPAGLIALSLQADSLLLQAVGALLTLGVIVIAAQTVGAAYVYATERTEVPV